MIVRSLRLLLLIVVAVLVLLALAFGGFLWQLSRGPLAVGFLTPLIERALVTERQTARIRLHDTILAWTGDRRVFDIRALGIQFVDAGDTVRATIPEMSVQLSVRALLQGLVAPTSLELFGPRMRIVRAPDGAIGIDIGDDPRADSGASALTGLIGELLQPPNPDLASGYLSRVAVRSALIEFDDLKRGRRLRVPRANIALRRDAQGIRAEGSVAIGDAGRALRADLSAVYRTESGTADLGLEFADVPPATLAGLDPAFAPLARLDARLGGALTLSLDADFDPAAANVELRTGAGAVDLAPMFDAPVAFDGARLRARSVRGLEAVEFEEISVALGESSLAVTGEVARTGEIWDIGVTAEVRDLPVNALAEYWPADYEQSTKAWVTGNIRDGRIDSAVVRASASFPGDRPEDIEIVGIDGEIRVRDAVVHYLRPLEPFRDVAATARFDANEFNIDIAGGTLRGMAAEASEARISGLSGPAPVETIRIEAAVAGPVRDALEILDAEPLGFVSGFGIDPSRTAGDHRTSAVFEFPLLDRIKVEEIEVAATSRLVGFGAENAAFGLSMERGDVILDVDRDGMEVGGTAEIAGIPLRLDWAERFGESGAFRTRYKVRARLDAAGRAALGIDAAPFVSGPADLDLTYTVGRDGAAVGAAEIDLTATRLSLDPLAWRKEAGVAGRASVGFLVQDEALRSAPEILVEAGDLNIRGSGLFRDGGGLRRLTLERLAFAENDLFAEVEFAADAPPVIRLGGPSIDLRPIVDDLFGPGDESGDPVPAMRIVVSERAPLERVRLGEETRLQGAFGTLVSDGTDWSDVRLGGKLSNGGNISLRVEPGDGEQAVAFESDDAGGILHALDWSDAVRGGGMRLRATRTGSGAARTLSGQLDMEDFVLVESPIGARILALTSLSGIADLLSNEGITFRRAEVPFTFTDAGISIENAKARGADMGLLASGRIDRDTDTIEMSGEIAPAYTLNSLLANIPLIGTLLSGGGDSIFAATFRLSGPADDPDVSVNPLAVLTPGIVRRLLTGFGDPGAAAREEEEEGKEGEDPGVSGPAIDQ